jgi:ubiquinone biosynthesis protein COQ9
LFWLGDDSIGHQATWDFLDRRVENVMQFEKLKGRMQANPLLKPMLAGPNCLMSRLKAPVAASANDLPGQSSNTQ